MNFGQFAILLTDTIANNYEIVNSEIESSCNKELSKPFIDNLIAKVDKTFNELIEIDDARNLIKLIIETMSRGQKIDKNKIALFINRKDITNFKYAAWLIREAIIFKDYYI